MEKNKGPLNPIDYWLALALTALALFVYILTLTPSLSYLSPDGNELATIPYLLGLAHSPGYPVYTWLGKLFTLLPFGDMAHRVNLMSAVMGALSTATHPSAESAPREGRGGYPDQQSGPGRSS